MFFEIVVPDKLILCHILYWRLQNNETSFGLPIIADIRGAWEQSMRLLQLFITSNPLAVNPALKADYSQRLSDEKIVWRIIKNWLAGCIN